MPETAIVQLPSAGLQDIIQLTSRQARQKGALVSIPTEPEIVIDKEIPFILRILASTSEKQKAATLTSDGSAPKTRHNPFLPWEQDLYVGHINTDYLCLLNKFNVIPDHFLVITSQFTDQQTMLTSEDFAAACFVIKQMPVLVFYNGGKLAGASQRHKHLQAIPLHLGNSAINSETRQGLPLDTIISTENVRNNQLLSLPFLHRFCFLNELTGSQLFQIYLQFCDELGLQKASQEPFKPYNLLLTNQWLLIVPRAEEHFMGISVNSLGFAGALLARTPEQLAAIRDTGPMHVLQQVTIPTT